MKKKFNKDQKHKNYRSKKNIQNAAWTKQWARSFCKDESVWNRFLFLIIAITISISITLKLANTIAVFECCMVRGNVSPFSYLVELKLMSRYKYLNNDCNPNAKKTSKSTWRLPSHCLHQFHVETKMSSFKNGGQLHLQTGNNILRCKKNCCWIQCSFA